MTVQMRIVKIQTVDVEEDPGVTYFQTWSEVLTEPGELVPVLVGGEGVETGQDLIDLLVGEADVEYV